MTVARSGASASVLKSGRVLIAGGESNGTVLATLETFDPVNNVFAPVFDSMSAARKNHAAAVLKDGRVLIAGGSSGASAVDSADIFDPHREQFRALDGYWRRVLVCRQRHFSMERFYWLAAPGNRVIFRLPKLYDPEKRTFTAGATLQSARHGQKGASPAGQQ